MAQYCQKEMGGGKNGRLVYIYISELTHIYLNFRATNKTIWIFKTSRDKD
jgi:hypothetical protein